MIALILGITKEDENVSILRANGNCKSQAKVKELEDLMFYKNICYENFNSGNETIDILLDVLLDFMEDGFKTMLHEAAEKGKFFYSI